MAYVNVTELRSSSGSTASATVTATAGNALIAVVCSSNVTGTNSVARTGDTWTLDGSVQRFTSGNDGVFVASAPNCTGGSVTCTFSSSAAVSGMSGWVLEYSGLPSSSILDTLATGGGVVGSNGTSTTPATGSLTNGQANALLVAFLANFDGNNPGTLSSTGTGWTMPATELDGNDYYINGIAYLQVSSIAARSEAWSTGSFQYATLIASFKLTSSATAANRDTSVRFRLAGTQAWRHTPARFRQAVLQWHDTGLRLRLQAVNQNWHDTGLRLRLQLQAIRDTAARFRLGLAGTTRDTAARLRLQSIAVFRDSGLRFIVQSVNQRWRDTSARLRLQAPNLRDTPARVNFRLPTYLTWRDTRARFIVQLPVFLRYRDTLARFRLQLPTFPNAHDTAARFKLSSTLLYRTTALRFRLQLLNQRWHDTVLRLSLATLGFRGDTPFRFRLTPTTRLPVYWDTVSGTFQTSSTFSVVDWLETTAQFQTGG